MKIFKYMITHALLDDLVENVYHPHAMEAFLYTASDCHFVVAALPGPVVNGGAP